MEDSFFNTPGYVVPTMISSTSDRGPNPSPLHQTPDTKIMDTTDAWAEVFALAGGEDAIVSPSKHETQVMGEIALVTSSQIVQQEEGSNDDDDPRVRAYLPPILPYQQRYYELQGLLLHNSTSPPCEGYTRRSNDHQDDQCNRCGKPSGYHRLVAKNPRLSSSTSRSDHQDENTMLASQLYVAMRNLRCCLGIDPDQTPPLPFITALQDHLLQILSTEPISKKPSSKQKRQRRRYTQKTSLASDTKLLEACRALLQGTLSREAPDSSREDPSSKDEKIVRAIQGIMECDAIYYRLYYADLISEGPVVIPHPVQYFGYRNDRIDPEDDGTPRSFEQQVDSSVDSKRRREVQLTFGVGSQGKATYALERLHQLRVNEGRFLFRKLKSVQDGCLWRAWQDSSRDFLCHLYSYATLPSTSLRRLQEILAGHSVVEIGAGTGYLARLIGNVDALDSHPGTKENEYHAATPPFTDVKAGGPKSIGQRHSALILCYPPVDNEMAYESLTAFLSRVSHSSQQDSAPLFVHIGEFQGLTGTPRFESLLLEKFYCIDRLPCLSWGSDAAEVTMWELRSQSGVAQRPASLLVPCVRCNDRPSIRRFRNARPFSYCSMECAKKDTFVVGDVLPSCFFNGLNNWTSRTDTSWQILRVAPRPVSSG